MSSTTNSAASATNANVAENEQNAADISNSVIEIGVGFVAAAVGVVIIGFWLRVTFMRRRARRLGQPRPSAWDVFFENLNGTLAGNSMFPVTRVVRRVVVPVVVTQEETEKIVPEMWEVSVPEGEKLDEEVEKSDDVSDWVPLEVTWLNPKSRKSKHKHHSKSKPKPHSPVTLPTTTTSDIATSDTTSTSNPSSSTNLPSLLLEALSSTHHHPHSKSSPSSLRQQPILQSTLLISMPSIPISQRLSFTNRVKDEREGWDVDELDLPQLALGLTRLTVVIGDKEGSNGVVNSTRSSALAGDHAVMQGKEGVEEEWNEGGVDLEHQNETKSIENRSSSSHPEESNQEDEDEDEDDADDGREDEEERPGDDDEGGNPENRNPNVPPPNRAQQAQQADRIGWGERIFTVLGARAAWSRDDYN